HGPLQRPHLLADRRLGAAQLPGRRGERPGLDHLLEHLQLAGVDHPVTITPSLRHARQYPGCFAFVRCRIIVRVTGKHLRDVPLAGMNAVLAGAAARGYAPGDPAWVNLGQGQPEIGDIPGAPPRITRIDLEAGDHAYGPVNGTRELR